MIESIRKFFSVLSDVIKEDIAVAKENAIKRGPGYLESEEDTCFYYVAPDDLANPDHDIYRSDHIIDERYYSDQSK